MVQRYQNSLMQWSCRFGLSLNIPATSDLFDLSLPAVGTPSQKTHGEGGILLWQVGGLWCLCVVSDPKWIFTFFHETPEQQLFNCQALRKLSIPDNDLSSLPTSIASLVNLRELDISKNGEGSKSRGSQGIGSCNEVLPPCDGEIRAPSQVSRLALWGRICGNPPLFFP